MLAIAPRRNLRRRLANLFIFGAFLILVGCARGSVSPEITAPPQLFSLQVTASGEVDLPVALRQAGHGPILPMGPVEPGSHSTVFLGAFDHWADAEVFRGDILGRGLVSEAEVWELPVEMKLLLGENHCSPHSIFRLDTDPLPPGVSLWSEEVNRVFDNDRRQEWRDSLPSDFDPAGEEVGLVTLARAYDHVHYGSRSEALDLQLSIARGEIPASPGVRLQACWDACRSYHQTGQRLMSYRAYTELQGICEDPEDWTACLVARGGLVVELAKQNQGTMDDVRTFLAEGLAVMPGDTLTQDKRRATMELMFGQTFLYDRDRPREIELMQALVDRHWDNPEARREIGSALYHIAADQYYLRDFDAAKAAALRLISMEIREEENFAGWNLDAMAGLILLTLAIEQHDETAAAEWEQYLRLNHPTHWETHAPEFEYIREVAARE